jgi:hypothetical protein
MLPGFQNSENLGVGKDGRNRVIAAGEGIADKGYIRFGIFMPVCQQFAGATQTLSPREMITSRGL